MSGALHGKEHKIRRSGRHAAPYGRAEGRPPGGPGRPGGGRGRRAGRRPAGPRPGHGRAGLGRERGRDAGSSRPTRSAAPPAARRRTGCSTSRRARPAARPPGPARRRSPTPPSPSTAPRPAPSATPSRGRPAPARPPPASGAVTCSATATGMLPENYAAIVSFLTSHGYTGNAAAGIAGNMYQESKGNPESEGDGGGGLIGWTPLPAGPGHRQREPPTCRRSSRRSSRSTSSGRSTSRR